MKEKWSRLVSNRVGRYNAFPRRIDSRAYFVVRNSWRRLHTRHLRLDRLLCGWDAGLSGQQFVIHTGDFRLTSVPISASPHFKFLEDYKKLGDRLLDPEHFQQTEYYHYLARFVDLFGHFTGALTKEQLVYVARNFVNKYEGKPLDNEMLVPSDGYSRSGQPVTAYPIEYSDCYQVADGHHRLAIACARGAKTAPVRVRSKPERTCLQQLLLSVKWTANKRTLYQPIESPEIGDNWRLARQCSDRLEMMEAFLKSRGYDSLPGRTYLDLGCYYGWFVRSMRDLAYDATGVEIDTAARKIGLYFYGLLEHQIIRDEIVHFLSNNPRRYDVVSCFSVMHHFVMGHGRISADELLRLLCKTTARVLFFEMGDENESWFTEKLAGWNPATIANWLREVGTFREVIPLGTDQDRVAPYEDQYARTLFACVQ